MREQNEKQNELVGLRAKRRVNRSGGGERWTGTNEQTKHPEKSKKKTLIGDRIAREENSMQIIPRPTH